MVDHLVGMLDRIWFTIPHAAMDLFKLLKKVFLDFRSPCNREMTPKNSVNTGDYEIMTNTDGLLTHPFRSTTGNRQFTDIIAQSTCLDHLGSGQQDTAIVDTRSQM